MLMSAFFGKVYKKCGRWAMPTMMMGSAATFIDCDECWKLLLVTRKGLLYVWEKCVLHDSYHLWLPWTQTLLQKMQVSLNPDFFMTMVLLFIIITWEPMYCPFEFWNFSSVSWQLCPLIGWLCVSFHLFTKLYPQSYQDPVLLWLFRPLAMLSSFDMSLVCWLGVADDCFPASNFASSWNLSCLVIAIT